MVSKQGCGGSTGRRYSPEGKTAAVRMVRMLRAELGTDHGTVQRVETQLDYGIESVRSWVKQADVHDGHVAGVTRAFSFHLRWLSYPRAERASESATLSTLFGS